MELVYRSVLAVGLTLFRFLGLRIDVQGSENLPGSGGAVLAVTHFGYLDFAIVEAATWRRTGRFIRFLVTDVAYSYVVAGPLLRAMRHIPVDRATGAAAYVRAVDALRGGELVGVFPEGEVSRSFTVKALKTGAVRMAAEADVPLVPVVVWGGHRVLTRGRPFRLRPARRVAVTVLVGAPERPARADDPVEATRRLRDTLTAMLAGAQRGYPDVPGGSHDRWWLPAHLGGGAPTPAQVTCMEVVSHHEAR